MLGKLTTCSLERQGEIMELRDYQAAVRGTDQRPGRDVLDLIVHMLGLAGEAGSVATAFKKRLRDGESDATYKLRVREELGDVLWYVATLANKLDLDLDEVATANLDKTRSRWLPGTSDQLDAHYPPHEQLPRCGTYEFVPGVNAEGRSEVTVRFNGVQVGSRLTDNRAIDDGYRFHDVFHLAYTTYLGWSPVTRALLRRKRKSDPLIDEAEDGGRAIVAEEGIALFAFAYGCQHNHLDGISRLDQQLLDSIALMTTGLEVSTRSHADFETAIIEGHRIYRLLVQHNGGRVDFDADQRSMNFKALDMPSRLAG
jgi:NTP pyrophosphatase (non-canonical NTP hydrolase)